MQKKNFLPILALAVGHLVTDLQAGALPIVLTPERNIHA